MMQGEATVLKVEQLYRRCLS